MSILYSFIHYFIISKKYYVIKIQFYDIEDSK